MQTRLSLRILAPTLTSVVLVITCFGWSVGRAFEAEIRSHASQEAQAQVNKALSSLQLVSDANTRAADTAMKILLREAGWLGQPSVTGSATVQGIVVPDLHLGSQSQVGNFALVDRIAAMTGATATLFVRKGENYAPVASNVTLPDGTRALSKELEAGEAYDALRHEQPYYGVVEILGRPYMTAHEPMRDRSGAVIGAWYVGYPLNAVDDLGRTIAGTRILTRGYLALLRANGKILFKSDSISNEEVLRLRDENPASGWTLVTQRFTPWGYTISAGFPERDIEERLIPVRARIFACALISCLLVVAVQYLFIAHLVLRPIGHLVIRMENADLNTSLRKDRSDEIGLLAAAFDRFVTRVREALFEVAETSNGVVTTSESISAGARRVATSVSTQKEQVAQIADVLHEMASQVHEVSANCARTADSARTAADIARNGGTLVEHTLDHMRTISASVDETFTRVEQLGRRSDQIGRIVSVIDDIAGQTSLLALNAAIEAARAGEQGRGFAVVAAEVRILADRTTGATQEIAATIEQIQSEIHTAAGCIQAGKNEVALGVSITGQAGAALKQIVADAERMGHMAAQIASATTQQASSTEQVYGNIEQINRFAGESADGAQKSAVACEQLSCLAVRLKALVARFDLSDHEAASVSPRPGPQTSDKSTPLPLLPRAVRI